MSPRLFHWSCRKCGRLWSVVSSVYTNMDLLKPEGKSTSICNSCIREIKAKVLKVKS